MVIRVFPTVDPYLAAENFLSTNNLPAYYLDQVAEFIVQNAGEYQGNIGSAQGADPFTGEFFCMIDPSLGGVSIRTMYYSGTGL